MSSTGNALASATPEALRLYRALLMSFHSLGPFQEEPKKTSVHLTNKSAFAGVHFRRNHLILTIKSADRIDSPRVIKAEQVSKNRWHCDVKVTTEAEIDAPLKTWMKNAYLLCG
jgi:hypothetical protein